MRPVFSVHGPMRRTDKGTAIQCDHDQDSKVLGRNLGLRGSVGWVALHHLGRRLGLAFSQAVPEGVFGTR